MGWNLKREYLLISGFLCAASSLLANPEKTLPPLQWVAEGGGIHGAARSAERTKGLEGSRIWKDPFIIPEFKLKKKKTESVQGGLIPFLFKDAHWGKLENAKNAFLDFQEHFRLKASLKELGLGLQWEHLLSRGNDKLGMKLGWEVNFFFDHSLLHGILKKPVSSGSPGEISFHGTTFRLKFKF